MTRQLKTEAILKGLLFALLILMLSAQIFAERGLFADGSFQLLNLLNFENTRPLSSNNVNLFHELVTSNNEPSRYFAYISTELPTVIALRLGATNLHLLTYLFSSWLLFVPLLFWGLSLWVLRSDALFWPFVVIFSTVYFGSNFFIIGEYNIALGFSAFALALMLRCKTPSKAEFLLLAVTAFLSILSYASTIFFGIFLAALALKKRQHEKTKLIRLTWLLLSLLFFLSTLGGLWGYLYPAHPENLQRSHDFGILVENIPFWATLIYIALLIYVFLSGTKAWRHTLSMMLIGFAILFYLIPLKATPFIAYSARVFIALTFFLLTLLLSWTRFYASKKIGAATRSKNYQTLRHSIIPIFSFFCALSILDIQSSFEFRHYLDSITETLDTHSGLLRYETYLENTPGDAVYGWTWTPPSLSLLLRKNEDAGLIIAPAYQQGRWQPFDPFVAIPDLSRYYKKR